MWGESGGHGLRVFFKESIGYSLRDEAEMRIVRETTYTNDIHYISNTQTI